PRDVRRGLDTVHLGHLDVQDHQVRTQLLRLPHGFLAITGLTNDLVALLPEHLHQVEPDERLVLSDEDAMLRGLGVIWLIGSRRRHPIPPGRARVPWCVSSTANSSSPRIPRA